ncbi:hypothetical protein ACN08N_00085 (plasmid) [Photobacterium leiognathi subsp. mandapamensis]|uniref:hypothetical protein n=1 Tax=Photobacterium leiognathi TaxID=553611 RepID=UPI003AF39B91
MVRKYCAEIEVYEDDEYRTYFITGITETMRDRAIERLLEDGGMINFEKYWTE